MRAKRLTPGIVVCVVLLGACGGGGSTGASPPRNVPDSTRLVHGQVAKGPLRAAQVSLYAIDGRGERASDTPLARALTSDDGSWSAELDSGTGAVLVESSGGSYADESDPEPDPARKRTVTFGDGEGLSAVLPADARTVALTVYSSALLLKARRETVGHEFLAVLENNRTLQRESYGFDPLTTLPADPIAPATGSSAESRRYALALGGAAQALNSIAIGFGAPIPTFEMIAAIVADLSDCSLDGTAGGAPIGVSVDGMEQPLPDSDLPREILRFRNNNIDAYAQTPLLVPDATTCARSGAAPDTIAPEIEHVPPPFTIPAIDARGTPAADPSIAGKLASVTATDDRPDAASLSNDAPAIFPLGATRVTFTAADAADNVAQVSIVVTVADLTPPSILAPTDLEVAQTSDLTPVALGAPNVNDNVSAIAELVVTNDAPAAFPVGVTRIEWTVRDGAGLTSSAEQIVTVLSSTLDSDGDGLSDADELRAGSDPTRVDSDADGVGDGLEVRVGSDPTRAAAHVLYVSPDGDDAAPGDAWARAKADNAGLGSVPAGTSASEPTFVLYAAVDPGPSSARWSLSLAAPCDHIVLVGSLGPDVLEPRLDATGRPTTTFVLDGGTGVALAGCNDVQIVALSITGASESGMRVSEGSVRMEQVHLRGNASTTTGGGLAMYDADVQVWSSVIAGNRADTGGGVAVDSGSIAIEDCIISGNRANSNGGGIALDGTRADSRIFDTLVTVNGAAQGGGLALTHVNETALGNLTLAWNEARDVDGGAGLAFDGTGSGPELLDSVFAGNRASGLVPDSVLGLTRAMSNFNLLEEAAIGPDDIDTSATGAGLVAGYHLDQAASPGVDSGSRSAAAAGLDSRYTDSDLAAPRFDEGTVDRGYHYADVYREADDFAIDQPLDALIQPDTALHVTLLHAGLPLGPGHQVAVTLGLDLVELSSSANVDPLGNGRSAMLGDLGNGEYVFGFGTPLAIGETTLSVQVDDVTLAHTLTVIVKSCDAPPDTCQRPHGIVLANAPGQDAGDEHSVPQKGRD